MPTPRPCLLVFEDGDVHQGQHFGFHGESVGELVFNTALSGYQEVLTDPSYKDQVVLMTYPSIGNTGINPEDVESDACYLSAFVVKELSPRVSNQRATLSLSTWLEQRGVVGISGLDTRAIVRKVRTEGSLRVIVSSVDTQPASLRDRVLSWQGTQGRDLVAAVTCAAPYPWTEGLSGPFLPKLAAPRGERPRLSVLDFGVKRNMLRGLHAAGFDVTVYPGTTSAAVIREGAPDCLFLSNGPGDPEPLGYAIATIRELVNGGLPTFGICLGHQLTGLALGGRTAKMKFGHHGANQPVIDRWSGR